MIFVWRYVIVHLHLARAKNFQMEIHMLCYWTRALDSQRCLRKGTLVRISVHTLNSDAVIVAVETVGRSLSPSSLLSSWWRVLAAFSEAHRQMVVFPVFPITYKDNQIFVSAMHKFFLSLSILVIYSDNINLFQHGRPTCNRIEMKANKSQIDFPSNSLNPNSVNFYFYSNECVCHWNMDWKMRVIILQTYLQINWNEFVDLVSI